MREKRTEEGCLSWLCILCSADRGWFLGDEPHGSQITVSLRVFSHLVTNCWNGLFLNLLLNTLMLSDICLYLQIIWKEYACDNMLYSDGCWQCLLLCMVSCFVFFLLAYQYKNHVFLPWRVFPIQNHCSVIKDMVPCSSKCYSLSVEVSGTPSATSTCTQKYMFDATVCT